MDGILLIICTSQPSSWLPTVQLPLPPQKVVVKEKEGSVSLCFLFPPGQKFKFKIEFNFILRPSSDFLVSSIALCHSCPPDFILHVEFLWRTGFELLVFW